MKRLALLGSIALCAIVVGAIVLFWWLPRHQEAKAFDGELKLALELLDDKQFEAAAEQLKAVLTLAEKFGEDDERVESTLDRLAAFYRERGDYAEAQSYDMRLMGLRIRNKGRDDPAVTEKLRDVASDLLHTGQIDAAETAYRQALQKLERSGDKESPEVATTLMALAEVYRARNDFSRAEGLFARAVDIRRKVLPKNAPELAAALDERALTLRALNRVAEADKLEAEARAVHAASDGDAEE